MTDAAEHRLVESGHVSRGSTEPSSLDSLCPLASPTSTCLLKLVIVDTSFPVTTLCVVIVLCSVRGIKERRIVPTRSAL